MHQKDTIREANIFSLKTLGIYFSKKKVVIRVIQILGSLMNKTEIGFQRMTPRYYKKCVNPQIV